MNTVSSVGSATERSARENPADSAASTTARHEALGAVDLQFHAVSDGTGPRHALEALAECMRQLLGIARGLDGDDGVGADAAFQLGRCVECEDLAVIHDRHTVAQLVGFFHVVGRQHDGLALGVESLEQLPQRQASLGVETGGGFVEKENRRTVEDRPGHHEPLRHSARQHVDRGLGEAGQLEPLQ